MAFCLASLGRSAWSTTTTSGNAPEVAAWSSFARISARGMEVRLTSTSGWASW